MASTLPEDSTFGAFYSPRGTLVQVAERIPFVNNLFSGSEDKENYMTPLGRDMISTLPEDSTFALVDSTFGAFYSPKGTLVEVAERIPFVNNGIQAMHKSQGEFIALERARSRNPVGSDGIVTQFGELFPIVCDGIEAIHRLNGQDLAAERASARTLPRLFSKDGTATKFAELFPGTNVVAALLHEMQGNHDEAMRAIDIFDSWCHVGDSDGPLTRLAELVPGMDVVAFGIHVNNGQYPQAFRSITKTRWVQVEFDSVSISIAGGKLQDIEVTESRIRDLQVFPKVMSLIVGLNDVLVSYLKWENSGNLRPTRIRYQPTPRLDDCDELIPRSKEFAISGMETQELLSSFVQSIITRTTQGIREDLPLYTEWSMDLVNKITIPRWRREKWRYYLLLKKSLPMLPKEFQDTLQAAFPRCTISHEPLQSAKHRVMLPPLKFSKKGRNFPEAALAVGAASAVGICGGKMATLACFSGLVAGTTVMCRSAFRYLYNHFNNYNIEAWEPAALRLNPDQKEEQQPELNGVMLELDKSDAAAVIDMVVKHVVKNIRGGCLAAPLLRMAKPVLKALLKCWGPEWQSVPFVMDIDIGDLVIEIDGWPNGLKIPNMRLALLLDINFVGNRLSDVRVVIPDSLVDEMFDSLRLQMQQLDMRTFDPRLAGFTEPLTLNFQMDINWSRNYEVQFELTKVTSTLHLPD